LRETEQRSLDPAVVAEGLLAALGDPAHRQYYVATVPRSDEPDASEVVGCCLVTTEWSDWTATWYWWFQSVYVLPEWRGKRHGVWDQLHAHVLDEALRAGVRVLKLYVHETNERAMRSYERLGMHRSPYVMFEEEP
jgi:GNAT superfamily N-acetyltransferase